MEPFPRALDFTAIVSLFLQKAINKPSGLDWLLPIRNGHGHLNAWSCPLASSSLHSIHNWNDIAYLRWLSSRSMGRKPH